jgi:thiol-disulfide isomerase/thioredoxin
MIPMKHVTLLLTFLLSLQLVSAQTPLDTAVDFSVKDIYGNTLALFPILDEGNLVVIDFFSTSCGPCAFYAPEIQASYEHFGQNGSNVFFMGISWGDDNAGVAHFDSLYGVTYPSVSGSQGGGNLIHNLYQINVTPTVILIAPDRLIVENFIWEPTTVNLNAAITAAGGSPLGTNDHLPVTGNPVFVYPNPSSGKIYVSTESAHSARWQVEAYNLPGSLVYRSPAETATGGKHLMMADMGGLPGGIYFIRVLKDDIPFSLNKLVLLD